MERVKLGRTGLDVCPIGLGCGTGIASADLEYAVDRGINYVFYSSDLHPNTYMHARDALKKICGRGSKRRDDVVLAACSYICDAEKIMAVILDQMTALKVDHVDVFFWGWVTRQSDPQRLVRETQSVVRTDEGRKVLEGLFNTARQVQDELRCRGYARYLGISTHDRAIARELVDNELLDVQMVRYNIAHRGAEPQLFEHLPATGRQGIVAFNTTHNASGTLSRLPAGLRETAYHPSHADLYKFALERPEVDVVLTGPKNRTEIDHALTALDDRPMDPRLYDYLVKLGHLHMGRATIGVPA